MKSSLLFFFVFNAFLIHAQISIKELNLKLGEYQVGFQHYTTYDSSRSYQENKIWSHQSIPRPISVSVWYPSKAKKSELERMSVLDYLQVFKEEEEWKYLPDNFLLDWFSNLKNTPQNKKHLQEKTAAYKGIRKATGSFPVLLYAPGFQGSSIENFALFEYLASHGYIILATPSKGTNQRWLDGGSSRDVETQARDLEFLLKEINKISIANRDQVATIAYSLGGLASMVTQMRNANIKAVVSLDGTERYNLKLLEKSPFVDLKLMNVPYIHFAQKDIPEQVLKEDKIPAFLNYEFKLYDRLTKSQAYSLKFNDLTHTYFSSYGLLFGDRDPRQDKSEAEIMTSYNSLCWYTLQFLEAHLKGEGKALEVMKKSPQENGLAAELVSLKSKTPAPIPYNYKNFLDAAAEQNFQNLTQLHQQILQEHSNLELPEGVLNTLGLQLVFNPQTSSQGINVFLFATKIYPQSSNLFDSLAEAYLFMGKKEEAIKNFKKSLDLFEGNQNAINRLKELEKK